MMTYFVGMRIRGRQGFLDGRDLRLERGQGSYWLLVNGSHVSTIFVTAYGSSAGVNTRLA